MNGKPVIVYVGAFELPNKNAAAHRVVSNAKIFRELGYQVVLLGVDKKIRMDKLSVVKSDDYFGFDCWATSYPSKLRTWFSHIINFSSLKFLIETHYSKRVVCVINYNHPAISQYRTLQYCRQNHIKHVADITEWYDTSAGPFLWRIVKKLDTALRMRWVNYIEDGLITTSPYVTDLYNDKQKSIVQLPTLFDCKEMSDFKTRVERDDTLKFCYVCSPLTPKMVNKKRSNLKERLDEIIIIFHSLHNQGHLLRLDVYGNTQEEYLDVFPEHTNILESLKAVVCFHGLTNNSVVRHKISDADFTIFIRDENRITKAGFPGKLAESISLGTPVLTNDMLNLSEFRGLDYLVLAKRGAESASLKGLLELTAEDKKELKERCFDSHLFDFHVYNKRVRCFFDTLGI